MGRWGHTFLRDSALDGWVRIDSKRVYSSDYFGVYIDEVRLPNGERISYDWFEAPDFCVVVPLRDEKLVMIENYRYPADGWFLEFPAGHLEKGEDAQDAAKRELEEETGYTPKELFYLQWYYPTSRSNQRAYVFVARVDKKGKTKREQSELQRVKIVSKDYLKRKILSGEVKHGATLVAFALALSRGFF